MTEDVKLDFSRPFEPPDALALIDREGFREAVDSYLMLDRQLRQEFAYWLADHRGLEHRRSRRDERERTQELSKEIGRRIVLLHRVNRAVYGETVA